ncbi:MAG: polymer-forming cytoskeletal protein [Longimicrobiales bacterium]
MARDRAQSGTPPEDVISIIGPGMKVVGDCVTTGSLRIEGTVQGSVQAGKAVVVGKEGFVDGDIETQDAVISGRVVGTMTIASRLEVHATCRIEGAVRARRMQLEEGASLEGQILVGEGKQAAPTLEHIIADEHGPAGMAEEAGSTGFSTTSGKLSKSV